MPPPVPLHRSAQLQLERRPEQRLCLRAGGQVEFEVEGARIVSASVVTGEGGAQLRLEGCLQPYGFRRLDDGAALFGPFDPAEAAGVVAALVRALSLPARPTPVSSDELRQAPERFHGRLVQSEGTWNRGREVLEFAGAWLTPPVGSKPVDPMAGPARVRVSGLWHSQPGRNVRIGPPTGGYGHFGLYPAELEAYRIEPL
jgi:hypothetical protein